MPLRSHLLHSVLAAASLSAQSIAVPNANAGVVGSGQLSTIFRNVLNPRTYLWGANAVELGGMPAGAVITGVSVRMWVSTLNTPSWPATDITWADYQILIGPAAPLAGWGPDILGNFTSPPHLVRSGPMTLPAASFTNTNPAAPQPNAWSDFYFDFQSPYVYTGGDLGIVFSHPGSTDSTSPQFPETVGSDANTYGTARVQFVHPASAATASSATTFYVMRIHYGYGSGCPGTGGRTPVLVASGDTTGGLGGTIVLQVGNGVPLSGAVFAFGFGTANQLLPNGCSLLLQPLVSSFSALDGDGRALRFFPVPPGILGTIDVQVGVLDPGAPGGFTVTNGVAPSAN